MPDKSANLNVFPGGLEYIRRRGFVTKSNYRKIWAYACINLIKGWFYKMKAKLHFTLSVLILFGLVVMFIGCVTAPGIEITPDFTPTEIEGQWKSFHPDARNATFTFTGNQFVYTRTGVNNSGYIILKDNVLQLVINGRIVREYPYRLDSNYLQLSQGPGQTQIYYYGEYQKL
jgi:hypothetical protein